MLLDLLGLTPEKIAENEKWDPKKGERTRDFGDKAGDAIMSVLTGRDYGQAVEDATKTTYTDTLRDAAGTRLTRYGSVVGGEDVSDLSRLTSGQLEQRLTSNQALKDSRTKASVTTGRDRSEYMQLNDPDAIMSLAAGHVKADKEKEKRDAEEKAEKLRQTIRNEGKEDLAESRKYAAELQARSDARQDALLAHQTEQTNLRNAHNANESNKTRLHELALQEARNNQTMQLAMMDREDKLADRRYAREDRAADRRQQSIMMLIKGLAQLGQGFSL